MNLLCLRNSAIRAVCQPKPIAIEAGELHKQRVALLVMACG
jgi:hypothetical protein